MSCLIDRYRPQRVTLTCLYVLCACLLLAAVVPAHAEELAFLGGTGHSPQAGSGTFNWQIAYRHPLAEHLSLGISYLNEGHFTDHHRDGYTPQLWAHIPLLNERVDLAAGVGPYFFFDTATADTQSGFRNHHGAKILTSLSATWYSENDWFLQVQGNYAAVGDSIDSIGALAGIGYRFSPSPTSPRTKGSPVAFPDLPNNEFTFMLGQTIANSLDSQRSVAWEAEYRHRFIPHLEGSVAFLFEGDSRLIRRDGLLVEAWVTQYLLGNRVGLGLGGGAYFDVESYKTLDTEKVFGIITLTASYRFLPQWCARVSWNRIVTDYDRDSDVIVLGAGYLF